MISKIGKAGRCPGSLSWSQMMEREENNTTWQAHARSILKAQLFIQQHLDEELTLHQVAKAACFSPYHFHRIFHAFTGESLNHYIRRLRLEKAAGRLRYTDELVTEIALDSGYQTPSAFTRAFCRVMGVSPKRYRSCGMGQFDGQKNPFRKKENSKMHPEIVQLSSQDVIFVRRVGSYQDSPAEAWTTLIRFAEMHHPNLSTARRFSIGLDDPNITNEEKLRFDACLTAPKEVKEKGDVGRQTLKGGKYAVFVHKGPYENLEETFDAIFQKWYPGHQDKVADEPCLCEHLNMELMEKSPEELLTKIYVPLK